MTWIKGDRFYILVMLLLILIIAIRAPLDTDMWWHLRAGEETWNNRSVYMEDTLSYTRAGEAWINHSWLAQVFMIGLYKLGEFKALSLWVGVGAVLCMYFVYLQMEGQTLLKVGLVLFASFVCSVVWSPRPQMFSLIMFALCGLLLYRYQKNKSSVLIWLLPVFILWSNMHGGYVLGIILIGTQVGGEILNKILGEESEDSFSWKEIGLLAIWGVVGFGSAAINPNGINMWKIPFQTIGVETLQNLIKEWASPDFHQPVQQLLLILLFGTFAAVGLSKKRLDGKELVSFIVFGILALIARRNFAPFAIVAAPVLARHLSIITTSWTSRMAGRWEFIKTLQKYQHQSEQNINKSLQFFVNLSAVLLLVAGAGYKWISVSSTDFIERTEEKIFPVGAVSYLKEKKPPGRLFNAYNWGGYLTWRLPEYQVFVDGRTDLFGDEIILEWLKIVNADNMWQKTLEDWNINTILVEKNQPIIKVLEANGWREVYIDNLSTIYQKE
ncbi:MAG: hypothetical protein WBB69_01275 [Anaerolineales bacterium]